MTEIYVKVTGATAEATKTGPMTRGMVGVPVTFEFSDVWNGLTKTAVYKAGRVTIDDIDIEDASIVPWELLKGEDDLYIGLYGVNKDGTLVIPTLWAYVGAPLPSADPSGDVSANPSLPVWKDLGDRVEKVETKVDTLHSDETALRALIETDMLPAVYNADGKILTDESGRIILRY